jgi:16S rRNA (guanine527-N7)-methyltransferase
LNEHEARSWLIANLDVSRETIDRLDQYVELVRIGQTTLNLVSASTFPTFWTRHIVDSAQLVLLAGDRASGLWLDIGSGAGIPGLVTAILTGAPTILVESRSRRAAFLQETANALHLDHVTVVASTVQKLTPKPVDVITARAVAALPALIEMALPFAHNDTVWLLPKGKTAQSELASLPRAWQGTWVGHASVTEADSQILVGRHIRMNGKR